ncbi:MAG: glycine cleavage system protein GcvH [Clostridiaceae bacterium]|nr:glycine cleavage system protein GcvH [Clostridiaceae bacterium]
MDTRKDLLYSKDHEWLKIDGNQVTVGITDYAQHALGDVVFVELPELNAALSAGAVLSVVESVKAASEVYTPVSGQVVAVNEALADAPEAINNQPYESWIAVLELADPKELAGLMGETAYQAFCAKEEA